MKAKSKEKHGQNNLPRSSRNKLTTKPQLWANSKTTHTHTLTHKQTKNTRALARVLSAGMRARSNIMVRNTVLLFILIKGAIKPFDLWFSGMHEALLLTDIFKAGVSKNKNWHTTFLFSKLSFVVVRIKAYGRFTHILSVSRWHLLTGWAESPTFLTCPTFCPYS